ncbi:hypothetical protein E2C01_000056 [Portunus trituberculatus]|uniref:Uncharacterized protein n=1 Tax=Portunus trituberculatus TaxID=210409 RepID=A0A5B7CDW0_PORTR|nr:hypothetical protein [Portunus trituberculatus]
MHARSARGGGMWSCGRGVWGEGRGGGWGRGLHTSWVKVQVGVGVGVSMGMNFVEHLQPMHVVSQGEPLHRGHGQGAVRGRSGPGQAHGGGWQPCTQHIMGQQHLRRDSLCGGNRGTVGGGRDASTGEAVFSGLNNTGTGGEEEDRLQLLLYFLTPQHQ